MIYKNKPECVAVGSYIPKEDAETLQKMADQKTKETGHWMSVSRLIREIVSEYLERQPK